MLFSSFTFIFLFLPITLILYFSIPKKQVNIKNILLFIMSIIFYSFGEIKFVSLMILSIIVNYIIALFMSKKNKKLYLIISIIYNIGILVLFKYSNFIIQNLNNIFNINIKLLNIELPIGISFYTFQIMSYVIDVYLEKVKVQKNFINIATYITLFPQLIAGPIVNYKTVEKELINRGQGFDNFAEGFKRFIIGLAKKVIIANNVAIIADAVFNTNAYELGTLLIWVGAIAYSLQIYFDFSGYSDMAIGLGKIFGFNFLENFNYPYISKSITEFWRRWHISLSSWFREYVYIPLGGNRCSKIKWYRNILIVWGLTGLWHGASWNFLLWGLYFAIILIMEKIFLLKAIEKLPKIFQHIYALILIIIGWIIFRIENINDLTIILKHLIVFKSSNLPLFIYNNGDVLYALIFIIIGILCSMPIINWFKTIKIRIITYINDIIIIALYVVTIIFLLSSSYNPFIYFRF